MRNKRKQKKNSISKNKGQIKKILRFFHLYHIPRDTNQGEK